jgi:hypothetical protein
MELFQLIVAGGGMGSCLGCGDVTLCCGVAQTLMVQHVSFEVDFASVLFDVC